MTDAFSGETILRLAVGTVIGTIIGLERQLKHRAAGLHTSALVSAGATLFATIGPSLGQSGLQVVANIVTGIGFLAGGVILKDGLNVSGLNTAATLWAVAALGALTGLGLYREALVGALVVTVLNATMAPLGVIVERKFGGPNPERGDSERP